MPTEAFAYRDEARPPTMWRLRGWAHTDSTWKPQGERAAIKTRRRRQRTGRDGGKPGEVRRRRHVESVVPPACTGTMTPATRRELDLYLMVDNQHHHSSDAWTNLIRGLKRYVAGSAREGTGVGIGFLGFVRQEACISGRRSASGCCPTIASRIDTAIDPRPVQSFAVARGDPGLGGVRALESRALPATQDRARAGHRQHRRRRRLRRRNTLIADAQAAFNDDPSISTYVLAIVDEHVPAHDTVH